VDKSKKLTTVGAQETMTVEVNEACGPVTVMIAAGLMVCVHPEAAVTVSETVKFPVELKICCGLAIVDELPSPKFQAHPVTPTDESVIDKLKGLQPDESDTA
jgi:hypothetical protein